MANSAPDNASSAIRLGSAIAELAMPPSRQTSPRGTNKPMKIVRHQMIYQTKCSALSLRGEEMGDRS